MDAILYYILCFILFLNKTDQSIPFLYATMGFKNLKNKSLLVQQMICIHVYEGNKSVEHDVFTYHVTLFIAK